MVPFLGVPKHAIALSDVAVATVLPPWDKEAEILNLEALLAVQTKFHDKTVLVACPKAYRPIPSPKSSTVCLARYRD